MTDQDEQIVILNARLLMMRDTLACVLGYVIAKEADPEAVLKKFFDVGEFRAAKPPTQTPLGLRISTTIQSDQDWIVSMARKTWKGLGDP